MASAVGPVCSVKEFNSKRSIHCPFQGIFKMKKIAAMMAFAFAFGISLAGCNTMAGAGQDMQKAGQKMENAADKKN